MKACLSAKIWFCSWESSNYMMSNRMRSIHMQIQLETQHPQWTNFHWQPTLQQQCNKPQQQEYLHKCTLHPWTRGKVQKGIQQFGDPCTFQGYQHHKTLLMAPKDRVRKLKKSGVIYKFKCLHINCPEEYIGESGRTFHVQAQGAS